MNGVSHPSIFNLSFFSFNTFFSPRNAPLDGFTELGWNGWGLQGPVIAKDRVIVCSTLASHYFTLKFFPISHPGGYLISTALGTREIIKYDLFYFLLFFSCSIELSIFFIQEFECIVRFIPVFEMNGMEKLLFNDGSW